MHPNHSRLYYAQQQQIKQPSYNPYNQAYLNGSANFYRGFLPTYFGVQNQYCHQRSEYSYYSSGMPPTATPFVAPSAAPFVAPSVVPTVAPTDYWSESNLK